jgi:hypothetical protein
MKKYRGGAIGALMDEYERAAADLKNVLDTASKEEYEKIVDEKTRDEDCRSIQTIISHVINSGYGYADYIRGFYNIPSQKPERRLISHEESIPSLNKMLLYTSETLEGKWEISEEEIMSNKIVVRWGPLYDMEQLLEHAIVHILRHRRQIEKFMLFMKNGEINF